MSLCSQSSEFLLTQVKWSVGGTKNCLIARLKPLLALRAGEGEGDEAVNELWIGDAGGLPELRVHADFGEAGDCIDFIDEDAVVFG